MRNKKSAFGLTCMLMIGASGIANSAETVFHYQSGKAGEKEGFADANVYASWNARDPNQVLKPGQKILFWGRGAGCDNGGANGRVDNFKTHFVVEAEKLTGIPPGDDEKHRYWTPSGDSPGCDSDNKGAYGPSFVHVNQGIGLFTDTGPTPTEKSFFRPYGDQGQGHSGANKNIEGTFVAFRFPLNGSSAIEPWTSDEDKPVVEISTTETVASNKIGQASTNKDSDAIQTKQQVIVSFANATCLDKKYKPCQIQYLLNIAVMRSGVTDWNNVGWFRTGGVFADPAQGGMPVVHGPLKSPGTTTFAEGPDPVSLWTSIGEPTQHDLFKDKSFGVTITYSQFQNAMKLAVAQLKKKRARDISSSDMTTYFGPDWNDPEAWRLLSTSIAHEVHDPFDESRAYIGGNVKELYIGPSRVR